MKQLSKDQWRKIHGIRPPKDPADADVIGRRPIHEAVVNWEIKWLPRLHLIFAPLAFVIVLLPKFNKAWHGVISFVPVISWLHREFSGLTSTLYLCLAFGLFLYFYSASKIDGESYSEYGYPINLSYGISPQNIKQAELYPRTKLEERVFFADSAGGIWLATFMWFVLFGGIAGLLSMKGV